MKKIVMLCACICACQLLLAQQPRPENAKRVPADESQAILKNLQNKWQGLQAVKISFTLQSETKGKKSDPIKGTLWSKGKAYKLQIPNQTIYCDGKTLWNFLPQNGEVSINRYEETEDMMQNPLKIIENYEKHYRSAFIGETAEKGVAVQIVDLYPKQVQSYFKIRLVIDKKKLVPLRISFHEKDGQVDTYYLDQTQLNPALNDSFFVFDEKQHPNVEIIDMRE
ncbi:MAG: outer membrane lipoprotein carrier protein LolA [Bacteroidales bacterium]|nr:outer membrane lipoprotein carrier protein LolA [Bacteroidales bacterium]